MSDEMAVIDKVGSEDVKFSSVEPSEVGEVPEEAPEEQQPNEVSDQQSETIATTPKESPVKTEPPFQTEPPEFKDHLETPEEYLAKMETDQPNDEANIKTELEVEESSEKEVKDILEDNKTEEVKRGIKRKASIAFSDIGEDGEDMKPLIGFDQVEPIKIEGYMKILERLEEEVISASKNFVPVRHVMGTPGAPLSASKRARTDTDGSRPSSGMSSRSDDAGTDVSAGSSPANRRRATTEMSSPLLRVPLERGWKRELVYRAALDSHSRRNADIYYYTPQGKKLRSSREVAEHLSGTGLSLENFSFFKEPLGVDDPEKEIIREAKIIRRVESPVPLPAPVAVVEGKRTPKPKAPKGASPEPTPKSPPAKIKVKSVGSRLSGSGPVPSPATKQQKKPQTPVVSTADNNNSAAWKKPRPPAHPTALQGGQGLQGGQVLQGGQCGTTTQPPQPPPPLQSRPALLQSSPDEQPTRQLVQPCSMSCGRGTVPSLSCAACLCLYHPVCAGYLHNPPPSPFYCKNCRKASSPPLEPPPLIHKSGVSTSSAGVTAPLPRRVPATTPTQMPSAMAAPMPVPAKVPKQDKRVLLRMKVAGSGAEGERVWSVTGPPRATPNLPQSIVMLNGRRFIVVPRAMVQPAQAQQHSVFAGRRFASENPSHFNYRHPRSLSSYYSMDEDESRSLEAGGVIGLACEEKRRGRIANGATEAAPAPAPAPAVMSPRRGRGRAKPDDTDHFTAFYNKAQDYNVVVQIFQYLGMRDLAHCARVCKLWQQLAATPALWRHVRMKNSHVSDWGGLCKALKKHGTKRLDLRKMLLPQNDLAFWEQFAQHISTVDTLERIEMCRCPASAVEAVCRGLPGLRALSAVAIRDTLLDPAPLASLPLLHELRLKSMAGLSLTRDLRHLATLTHLQHLSLTSIKELGWCACDVIGSLPQLESLELGECTFRAEFASVLAKLQRLRRLRLERGTAHCAAPAILRALARLPLLTRLELVNIDVKVGFDDALAECKNIQRLLIIPTYVSQSATTNKQVLSGVLRLKDTLTHLMWGVTIELLRVTELFIDQCEAAGDAKRRDLGECIPVLKPVPGCKLPADHHHVASPPQVEILPLPTLQRLLSAQLPNTKLKLLRIPFHATWRQSLADFQ